MNIVITLPQKLWWAIMLGNKTYECRKSFPQIQLKHSKVYVVIKGTTKVAGYFTIDSILSTNDFNAVWRNQGSKLFIDWEWFNKYVKNYKRLLHLWKISRVYSFDDTVDLEEYFGIKHNPQSFVYTNKEPYVRQTLKRILDEESNKLIHPSTYLRRTKKDDLPF